MKYGVAAWCFVVAVAFMSVKLSAESHSDRSLIGELDLKFQAAVKRNDAVTMADILHPDMVLVVGDGRTFTRDEQLHESKEKLLVYEIQDEEPGTQIVRVNGDTGVVTALLRIKGTNKGVPFDRRVWFSDTYVRTPSGWKYFFGQASLALPEATRSTVPTPTVPEPARCQEALCPPGLLGS